MKRLCSLILLLGCSHSDSFDNPDRSVGPFNTGNDLTLTLNPSQDYWPAWTQDGRGILYAYVDSFVNQQGRLHRCLGMLSPSGGTRIWQLCDNRAQRDDSTNSYAGFAVDSSGRLLVAEAVSRANSPFSSLPQRTTLWLADTAHPYARVSLASFPQAIGGTNVQWLSGITWTGPNTFMALGQQFLLVPTCNFCFTRDSAFTVSDGVLIRGTISGGSAALQAIPGTLGATGYSLAEGGGTIVLTMQHDVRLFRVPLAGGTITPAYAGRDDTLSHQQGELVGVTCKGSTCIVSKAPIQLAGDYIVRDSHEPSGWGHQSSLGAFLPGVMELHSISIASGADQILRTDNQRVVFAAPRLSPVNGDLVVQLGGGWGNLQTHLNGGPNGTLHLYKSVLP